MKTHKTQIKLMTGGMGADGRFAKFEVHDALNGLRILSVELNIEQLGRLIAGDSLELDGKWSSVERLGWQLTVEHHEVTVEDSSSHKDAIARAAFDKVLKRITEHVCEDEGRTSEEVHVDGNISDIFNHHRLIRREGDKRKQTATYRVGFRILRAPYALKSGE